jgi:gamma-glutamyltranspeptidase/glutathione hydrolase
MRSFITLLLVVSFNASAVPVEGHKIMISAPNHFAVEVGKKIFAKGGNVIDVAVAAGLTLAVTAPYYASLGGGGFALVKMTDTVEAFDFRETGPGKTHRDYYADLPETASRNGGHAVAVPGFPAGLYGLHQRFGKLKWKDLFVEPIKLARDGFPVSGEWVRETEEEKDQFNKSGVEKLFKKGGLSLKPGEILKQPALAKALTSFRDQNLKGFYEGSVAKDLVDSVKHEGGQMTAEDLKNYKMRKLSPLVMEYEGHKIYLMPPPSSGGVLIWSALKLIEKLGLKNKPALGVDEYHYLGEIESRVFRGRTLLGDPDFHKNPTEYLTSTDYIDKLKASIKQDRATTLEPLPLDTGSKKESSETTHFSVMDADGHAIALTVTLNGGYGSGVVSEKFGIALNNEMDDFTTKPGKPNMFKLIQGPGNDVGAGKRPLSSMSPTLVEKAGRVIMAIGAPGGPRIISAVLQVIYRIIGRGVDTDLAIQLPRVHHQFLPDTLFIDRGRFSPEVIDGLKARGHKISEGSQAKVYVVRLRSDGVLEGAFDSRGEGAAGGF